MICKHFLIVKLTLSAVCQMCTHGTAEFPTALNSLHNYEMKCWWCFTVIALSTKCFSKLQLCNYKMLMIKSFTPTQHFRKFHPFLFILYEQYNNLSSFYHSNIKSTFYLQKNTNETWKKLILYILLSCFQTLQLCEPKLKQLTGVSKRVLSFNTIKIHQSIKLFYWFPLNSVTNWVLPGFSCK